MKIIVIPLNQEHFGLHITKKKVSKYEQLNSVISSLADRSISLIHPVFCQPFGYGCTNDKSLSFANEIDKF